ncbi:unnamed protein product [Prorocentrum cordatum]|uniref:EF-hand domain-containing protein n=1 Tax=Prorocentrum cordatum TaxID=2364126 RepID=A0ABN9Q0W6_9DINO|nr:unnamed protein product [Polarella glacialis]
MMAGGMPQGMMAGLAQLMQQQARQQPPQQQHDRGGAAANASQLSVSGCAHATVGAIVRGSFTAVGQNHGKPSYKKDTQVNGLDVMLYFWDERDGQAFSGWWFGPKVGGDQVWAYHPSNTMTPPTTGWKVPCDGPVDPTFAISFGGQQQQQQQPQQSYGQQRAAPAAAGGMNAAMQAMQNQAMAQVMQNQAAAAAAQMQQKMLMEQQKQMQMKKIEDMKRQQEELKMKQMQQKVQREAELVKKRQEQTTLISIRRVIQKLRTVTPENFAEVKQEVEALLAKELGNCGLQAQKIQDEAKAGLQMAAEKVEKMEAVKREAQEKLAEAARRREEVQKLAEELLKELESLVDEAEKAVKTLKDKAEPLKDAADMSIKLVEKNAKAVEEKGDIAKAKLKAVSDFVKENSAKIRVTHKVPVGPTAVDTGAGLAKASARNSACTKECNEALVFAETTVAKMRKKAEAKKQMDALNATFAKFDKDGDGILSKPEVKTYARTTHKFAVGDAAMAQIFKILVEGDSKGVKRDDFQRLRVQVGIAREQAMDAERKKARLEKEAKMEELKKEVQGSIDAAAEAAKATGELVDKVQAASKEVVGKAMQLNVEELDKEAEELDKLLEEAKESIAKSKETVTGLLTDVDEDIKAWMTQKAGEIKGRIHGGPRTSDQRLGKVAGSPNKLRDIAKRKVAAEMEALEAKALSFLRYHQTESKLSRDELFKAVDADKDGKISEAEFVKFFVTCKRPPKPQDPKAKADADGEEALDTAPDDEGLQKVFKHFVDEDGEGFLTKERFASVVRHLMKVVTVSVLSKELKTDSEAVRKLESREVVEVLEGPMEDEVSKMKRVKVIAMRDGAEGYVTLAGNGGTVFLRDGGRLFKVLREVPMTDKFELDEAPKQEKPAQEKPVAGQPVPDGPVAAGPVSASAPDGVRKLKAGELIEVIEYPKKDEKSGSMRLKCKAKSDGHVGYATFQGNTGAVFMDCV